MIVYDQNGMLSAPEKTLRRAKSRSPKSEFGGMTPRQWMDVIYEKTSIKPSVNLFTSNSIVEQLFGELSYTSTTPRTFTDDYGRLIKVDKGLLRYTPKKGALIESYGENKFKYSEEFTNSWWLKRNNINVLGSQGLSPTRVNNANKIYPTSSGSNALICQRVNYLKDKSHGFSIYAKAEGKNVLVVDGTSSLWGNKKLTTYFDLSKGEFSIVGDGVIYAEMEELMGGWYRCCITTKPSTNSGFYDQGITFGVADNVGSKNYTASGQDGLLVFGAQLESGGTVTSYIPSNKNIGVRSSETLKLTLENNYFTEDMTVLADVMLNGNSIPSTRDLFSTESSPVHVIRLLQADNGRFAGETAWYGNGDTQSTRLDVQYNKFQRWGFVLSNDGKLKEYFLDGEYSQDQTDNSVNSNFDLNSVLLIGGYRSSARLNGWIKNFHIYKKSLSKETMMAVRGVYHEHN